MRKGFFLGDGAGVGKGRTIAACIKEHFAAGHGTRALWVSVSKDLNFDAQRDLDDVKAGTKVFPQVCAGLRPSLRLPWQPCHCFHILHVCKHHGWNCFIVLSLQCQSYRVHS